MRNLLLHCGARVAAVTAAAVFLSACAQDLSAPIAPPLASEFSGSVAGAVQAPLSGKAALLPIPADTLGTTVLPPAAVLGLVDKSGTVVAIEWDGVTRPKVGTYNIGFASSDIAMNYDQQTGAPGSSFNGTKGTVTITSANGAYVSGTFAVNASAQDTKAQIMVAGTFNAEVRAANAGPSASSSVSGSVSTDLFEAPRGGMTPGEAANVLGLAPGPRSRPTSAAQ